MALGNEYEKEKNAPIAFRYLASWQAFCIQEFENAMVKMSEKDRKEVMQFLKQEHKEWFRGIK